jgi:phosphinothricin acetyltransferase
MGDLRLRLVERRDAEAIRSIYNVEVADSTVTFDMVPRTIDEQVAWIDEHSGGHPAIVAVDGDVVVGFGSLSVWRERPAYSGSVEDSVYVQRDQRGRGIGKLLLEELVRLGEHLSESSVLGVLALGVELQRTHELRTCLAEVLQSLVTAGRVLLGVVVDRQCP